MAIEWTTKINVTSLSLLEADVTATRTETVGEDVTTWSRTLENREFSQAGKTMPQIRAEMADEFKALHTDSVANDAQLAQITSQESLLADALNALET